MKDIFKADDNWNVFKFLFGDQLRDVEIKETEKMLRCNDKNTSYFVYYCPNCEEHYTIGLGCRSRLCSNCGKYYTDKWADNISKAMFDVPHRHIVLGSPPDIWDLLFTHRDLWKVMMDSAIDCLNSVLSHKQHKRIRVGAIIVLHPFSRDLSFKPHLHLLITEGGFHKNQWVHDFYFPHNAMRKTWQYNLLTNLRKSLPRSKENSRLFHSLYRRYRKGFYVYLPKNGRVVTKRDIAKYIGRYIRHPAIANSRIDGYDGKKVQYWYKDNEEVRHNCEMPVMDFIHLLIQHIPEPQFKMIRYYGAYSRKLKKKYARILGQQSITSPKLERFDRSRRVHCPKCGKLMEFVLFMKKSPPMEVEFGSRITHWNSILISTAN
ncbi:MAG: transposase [Candidatus Thorarchaeota archaeon]|nr:transposase [Candidatus Thorarchaeota archaeon]